MEQSPCWMLANRGPRCPDDSWEEKAFADDAAGLLGGCVWPPRSYSCNFCKREFRSAQALGGHMNVHRRDRARLKQLSNFQHLDQRLDPHRNSQSFSIEKTPHKQIDIVTDPMFVSINQTIFSPQSQFVSSFLVSNDENLTFLGLRKDGKSRKSQCEIRKNIEIASSSLDLDGQASVVHNMGASNRHKRRKLDISYPPSINKSHKIDDEAPKADASTPEDLDLELRLGDRPKVQQNFL